MARPPQLLASAAVLVLVLAFQAEQAVAGTVVPCDEVNLCSWEMELDGVKVLSGAFAVDPVSGEIIPPTLGRVDVGDSYIAINSLSGNSDPIIGFGLGAGTGASGSTFSFTFNLPIAIAGPIAATSQVSYSLTATSAAGAQVAPFLPSGRIVNAFEVDTSVGGLTSLNKGVDVGETFFFTTGPGTQSSTTYAMYNLLTGNLAYDRMSVTVAFSLSANSNVGISGFVEQVPVPLPAGLWLLASSLAGLVGVGRRASGPRRHKSP
jgi:hypothetical protein